MSGIGHAISKIFKGAVGLVKKVWKPLVIAAAVYFTGGAALGAMGALSAGTSVLGGIGAGLGEAAGGIGIGAGTGIGDAFAAGAGTLGAGADVGALTTAGETGLVSGGAAATDPAGVLGSFSGPGIGGTAAANAGAGWSGALTGADSAYNGIATTAGSGIGPSSLWQNSLGIAKSVLTTPGVPSLIGGLAQGLMAGNLQNAQFKWQEAHAPGQVAGGVSKDAFSGFATNKNLTPATPNPTAQKLPQFTPYNQPAQQVPIYQVGAQPMPGTNEPGPYTGIGGQWPGYGVPGYGQQYPPGYVPPGGPQPPGMLQSQQGLLSQTPQQMPFIESPYDESYV